MDKMSFWALIGHINAIADKDPEACKKQLKRLQCADLLAFSQELDSQFKMLEHCGVLAPESTLDFARMSDDVQYYTFGWVILMGEGFFKMVIENPIPSRALLKYLLGSDAFFDLTEIGENFVVTLSAVMEERRLC